MNELRQDALTALRTHTCGRTGLCLGCLRRPVRHRRLWPCVVARVAVRIVAGVR